MKRRTRANRTHNLRLHLNAMWLRVSSSMSEDSVLSLQHPWRTWASSTKISWSNRAFHKAKGSKIFQGQLRGLCQRLLAILCRHFAAAATRSGTVGLLA